MSNPLYRVTINFRLARLSRSRRQCARRSCIRARLGPRDGRRRRARAVQLAARQRRQIGARPRRQVGLGDRIDASHRRDVWQGSVEIANYKQIQYRYFVCQYLDDALQSPNHKKLRVFCLSATTQHDGHLAMGDAAPAAHAHTGAVAEGGRRQRAAHRDVRRLRSVTSTIDRSSIQAVASCPTSAG